MVLRTSSELLRHSGVFLTTLSLPHRHIHNDHFSAVTLTPVFLYRAGHLRSGPPRRALPLHQCAQSLHHHHYAADALSVSSPRFPSSSRSSSSCGGRRVALFIFTAALPLCAPRAFNMRAPLRRTQAWACQSSSPRRSQNHHAGPLRRAALYLSPRRSPGLFIAALYLAGIPLSRSSTLHRGSPSAYLPPPSDYSWRRSLSSSPRTRRLFCSSLFAGSSSLSTQSMLFTSSSPAASSSSSAGSLRHASGDAARPQSFKQPGWQRIPMPLDASPPVRKPRVLTPV